MEPAYGRIVSSMCEFWELAKDVCHFAVARNRYFHHFIVASWLDAKQKIYEYYVSFKKFVTGPGCGEFTARDIDKNEIENAINQKKLYVVENPEYPKTDKEKEEATKRFWSRWGERAYSLARNNCETIVNYIFTGIPVSKQIEYIKESEAWQMIAVDLYDVFVSNLKRNMFKASCSSLIGTIAVQYFIKGAVNTVSEFALKELTTRSLVAPVQPLSKIGSHVVKEAAKKNSLKFTQKQILASKKCTETANVAGKQAMRKTSGATLIATGLVEGLFAWYEISEIDDQETKGHISREDAATEKRKICGGAVGASAGSVAGGAIGQVVLPVPVIGYAVGSLFGNLSGRFFGRCLAK